MGLTTGPCFTACPRRSELKASCPFLRWTYSVSTDVLGAIAEVVTGKRFDRFLQDAMLGAYVSHRSHVTANGRRARAWVRGSILDTRRFTHYTRTQAQLASHVLPVVPVTCLHTPLSPSDVPPRLLRVLAV